MLASATDLTSYLYCPRKLYLSKVLGIREPARDVMVLGTVRHAAYEGMGNADQEVVQAFSHNMSEEELLEQLKTAYAKVLRNTVLAHKPQLAGVDLIPGEVFVDVWQHILAEAQLRAADIHSFAASSNLFGDALWQQLEPKVIPELRIESEELQLKGIVDQIEVYGNGTYVPVELKTGRTPMEGVWPGHRIQVGAYALLVGEKFNTEVQESVVRYLDTQQKRQVMMNPFLEMEVRKLTQRVLALLERKDMPACSCKFKKGSCEELLLKNPL